MTFVYAAIRYCTLLNMVLQCVLGFMESPPNLVVSVLFVSSAVLADIVRFHDCRRTFTTVQCVPTSNSSLQYHQLQGVSLPYLYCRYNEHHDGSRYVRFMGWLYLDQTKSYNSVLMSAGMGDMWEKMAALRCSISFEHVWAHNQHCTWTSLTAILVADHVD